MNQKEEPTTALCNFPAHLVLHSSSRVMRFRVMKQELEKKSRNVECGHVAAEQMATINSKER